MRRSHHIEPYALRSILYAFNTMDNGEAIRKLKFHGRPPILLECTSENICKIFMNIRDYNFVTAGE